MQAIPVAFSFALVRAGSSKAARMAMMAITTRSSIKVNPLCEAFFSGPELCMVCWGLIDNVTM